MAIDNSKPTSQEALLAQSDISGTERVRISKRIGRRWYNFGVLFDDIADWIIAQVSAAGTFVESVTGDTVDNTDPLNPIITITNADIASWDAKVAVEVDPVFVAFRNARVLQNAATQTVLNWATPALMHTNGNTALNWSTQLARDSNNVLAYNLGVGSRKYYDTDGVLGFELTTNNREFYYDNGTSNAIRIVTGSGVDIISELNNNSVLVRNDGIDLSIGGAQWLFIDTNGIIVGEDNRLTNKWCIGGASPPTETQTGWVASNVSADRTYDANSTTLDEIADVLGTLIADLKKKGVLLA